MQTVIYHSADYDGIFCREIAKKFLGPGNADSPNQYIGWNFGDPKVPMPASGEVYIMDLSPECLEDGELGDRVIWIDHHKTSIEKWTPDFGACSLRGYRIDGVAACRLAWQWFSHGPLERLNAALPEKDEFLGRKVVEPLAVRLAGEYDIWDRRDPRAQIFQFGLRSAPLTPEGWNTLLSSDETLVTRLLGEGEVCQRYAQSVDASNMHASFIREWEGLKFLCLNGRGNSNTFASRDLPETGHDALLMFYFTGAVWLVSLYHAKHRTHLDLSKIAVAYGGGGHKGACGFTCEKLPFMT